MCVQLTPASTALSNVGKGADLTNRLQVSWETRQYNSLNVIANYTFSKMMVTGYNQWYLGDAADFIDTQEKIWPVAFTAAT
jgi:hypothetical protein